MTLLALAIALKGVSYGPDVLARSGLWPTAYVPPVSSTITPTLFIKNIGRFMNR